MTKAEIQKAFLHRLPVIYTPLDGEPMRYEYIEAIEYATNRFNVFELGAVLHNKNVITHVPAERVEIEDEKERESANTRPCPFKMPDNFNEYKEAFLKCKPVTVKTEGKEKIYPRITKLTVKLDYYGEIIFTVTVGKSVNSREHKPEDVTITSYKELIGAGDETRS